MGVGGGGVVGVVECAGFADVVHDLGVWTCVV